MKKYSKLFITIIILLLLIAVHNFNHNGSIQYKGYETKIGDMLTPRTDHTSMLIDDNNILTVVGNYTKNGIPHDTKKVEIYNIQTQRSKRVHNVNCSGYLTLVKKDNRILVLGGNLGSPINGTESVVEEYNPQTQNFSILHKNNIRLNRSPHLVLKDGNIYVYNSEKPYIYNPLTNKKLFTPKPNTKATRIAFWWNL